MILYNYDEFINLRSDLFTGEIVFKEFVDLMKYENTTNEYWLVYFKNKLINISRNSNQPENSPFVPLEFAKKFENIQSDFYTIDFGELNNGTWIVLETGDGQVSGLPPTVNVFNFYEQIKNILT